MSHRGISVVVPSRVIVGGVLEAMACRSATPRRAVMAPSSKALYPCHVVCCDVSLAKFGH